MNEQTLVARAQSPLAKLPGPWYSKYTHYVLKFQNLGARRVHYIHAMHQRYGPIVRISPEEVAIADVDASVQIHKPGSGFLKSAWYDSATGGREPGIFAMRDPKQHAARRRLFARAFSNSSLLRNWEPELRQDVTTAVSSIKADAMNGEADVMKWWTLMTTDIIAHLAFGESFGMLKLGKVTVMVIPHGLSVVLLTRPDNCVHRGTPGGLPRLRAARGIAAAVLDRHSHPSAVCPKHTTSR
jgi:cytochrome P450